ncbi:MAG: electron transfer flavoprotein subunit beta/FixA family protein [Sphaerochaeta sp.]|jgi:electron transfer flavoprotein beta subunit|uniref:electron transfer flavoprotein subunit beta/FixA family protein n=1 Tax=unclassified Sphaerochaeta TaxID=2637943 RepID=UPI0025E4275D|nr:electron transfer flavoprotein subunit beta/FixA family protein [Sphaerochaeta sp. UBA5836]
MHIIVPIKQVPQTSDVQMDKQTGTMIRSSSASILNPLDLYAISTALQLKDRCQARVSVITMGPQSAVKVLKEAIAMGCDDAVHLTDRAFGGSDTWATSYILSLAVKKLGIPDLIITGERATDGDTAQVGPALASWLGLPAITYVSKIETVDDTFLVVERLMEEGYQKVRTTLPALLTVVKEISSVRLPTLSGKKRAMASSIAVWDAQALDADSRFIGLKGSPTKVVKIDVPKVGRNCIVAKVEDDASLVAAVDQLMAFLDEKDLLPKGGAHHG